MEMEPKRCWMWEKKKKKKKKKNFTGSSDHFQETTNTKASSYDDSWEEQAFAEDAAGHLGGCVWPPRSYSCSFCKREFRSAQALGGHMNVHRRDRARLKHESFKPQMENHQIPAINNPFTSMTDPRHPSQLVCDLVYNPNPKSSSSCLAALPTQNLVESDHTAMRNDSAEATHSPINLHKWHQGTDLSRMTCDLRAETYRSQQKAQTTNSTDGKDDAVCCKRKRTDAPSSVAFFFRSSAQVGEHYVKSEVLGLSHSSIDDLDLELRLGGGGRPKPKLK